MLICITHRDRIGTERPCCRPQDQDCQQCKVPERHGLKWNPARVRWERTHPHELHRESAERIGREALGEEGP